MTEAMTKEISIFSSEVISISYAAFAQHQYLGASGALNYSVLNDDWE